MLPILVLIIAFILIAIFTNWFDKRWFTILYGIVSYIFANTFYAFITTNLSNDLSIIENQIELLQKGKIENYKTPINNRTKLFSGIQQQLSSVFKSLNDKLAYIQQIDKGELNAVYKPIGPDDAIGNNLLKLTQTLKQDNIELEKAKNEEAQRNWMASGLAKFGDLLRTDSRDIRKLGFSIMSNLVDYIDANQGAIYVLQEEEEGQTEPVYQIASAIAYEREKLLDDKVNIGVGLVGRCAFEQKTVFLTDIPNDYIKITSGLGTANPKSLLIVPCIIDDKVFGIIEIASFNVITKFQIDFIEKLGESIASTLANVRINIKTSKLLEDSRKQGEELAAQEEELRQNLEEMEATQEDLRRQMDLNSQMREELGYEKFLFDTLLENIPSRVFFKDKQSRFIKASKSVALRYKKESYAELAGMSDYDLLKNDFALQTAEDERKIMETLQGKINYEEHEVLNGVDIWKIVTKMPLVKNNECIGTWGIVNDITQIKQSELKGIEATNNFNKCINSIKQNLIMANINLNGNIVEANELFKSFFNLTDSHIVGKNFVAVISKFVNKNSKTPYNWDNIIGNETANFENLYNINNNSVAVKELFITVTDVNTKQKNVLYIACKSA